MSRLLYLSLLSIMFLLSIVIEIIGGGHHLFWADILYILFDHRLDSVDATIGIFFVP